MSELSATVKPGIHVLAKPIGPVCDIQCDYCFYLEKRALFGRHEHYRMPDAVLAAMKDGGCEPIPWMDYRDDFPEQLAALVAGKVAAQSASRNGKNKTTRSTVRSRVRTTAKAA